MAGGVVAYFQGQFNEAAGLLSTAFDTLQEGGFVYERVSARMFLIWSLAHLGRFRDLRRHHREGLHDARLRGDVYAEVNLSIGISSINWLVEGRPDVAERAERAAMERWTTRGFHMEHYFALLGRIAAGLYVGDVARSHALATELLARTRASLLWRLRNLRLRAVYTQGSCALAMVEAARGDRSQLLGEVARSARFIEQARLDWMQPFAAVLRAGISLHVGARSEALAGLAAAGQGFIAHDLRAHAWGVIDRAARIRSDAASEGEVAGVASWFEAEDVVAPERLIATLLPGLAPA
jgi:hypothetical protein